MRLRSSDVIDWFRPFRAGNYYADGNQGVALGYRMSSRWDEGCGTRVVLPMVALAVRRVAAVAVRPIGAMVMRRVATMALRPIGAVALHPIAAINHDFLAPKGYPVKALGNALGISPNTFPSPERA